MTLTNARYQDDASVTSQTAKRDLKLLQDLHLLEAVGETGPENIR